MHSYYVTAAAADRRTVYLATAAAHRLARDERFPEIALKAKHSTRIRRGGLGLSRLRSAVT